MQWVFKALWVFTIALLLGWLTESYWIGAGLATVSGKIVFGTLSRWEWVTSFVEGAVGAAIGRTFRVQERVSQAVYDQVGVRVEEVPGTLLSDLREAELGTSP